MLWKKLNIIYLLLKDTDTDRKKSNESDSVNGVPPSTFPHAAQSHWLLLNF